MCGDAEIRKEGREAFIPGENAYEICPYYRDFFNHRMMAWLNGWFKAEEEQKEDNEFLELSLTCPWSDVNGCQNDSVCSKENCAPWHFRKGK